MSDFMNALALGTQARVNREQINTIERRRSAAPHVQAAIGGDTSAIGRIAEADPDYALKVGSLIQSLDAGKQAVLKRAADFTTQAGMGVLNTPEAQRPAAYDAARLEAQRNGIPTESWPKAYDANAESWLKFNVNKAIPVATWFNKQNKGAGGGGPTQFDFATPGGGAPAAPQPRGGGPMADAQPPGQPPVQVAQAPMQMPGAGIAQGDEPQADGSGTPLQPKPQRPTGSVWNEDPTKHGLVMRGEKDKYGNVKPVDVGGHFLYRDPKTNEHVLYKPREAKPTERPLPQPGYQWTGEIDPDGRPKQAPITGGGADPDTIRRNAEVQRKAGEVKKPEAIKKLETEVNALEGAISNFEKIITDQGGGTFAALVNDPRSPQAQKVLGAYNAMKTALRSEAFVNTGVLQPAEMKMLDDMLLAPSSVRGYLATPDGYRAMLGEIRGFVRNKLQAANTAYGVAGGEAPTQPGAPAPSATQPGVASPPPPRGTPAIAEGATATNPQTGAKIIYRGGQWVAQ